MATARADITESLGVQVRQAVELLVTSFARSGACAPALTRGDAPPEPPVPAAEVYRGAVTVMMRLVFLLFAEESGLLPADNELYAASYSAGRLHAELEQRVAGARGKEAELEHSFLAWCRLLALFTVVHQGVSHPELRLIAHDGSLFDPGKFPWFPLAVDDRTVLHMLRAVRTVTIAGERRTVSFRTLTVEQIGYVYEGLLSCEGFRAAGVMIGLAGKEGREAQVPLAELEALGHAGLPEKLNDRYKHSGIGSVRALTARLAPLAGDDRARAEARLYAVARDRSLVRRLLPYYGIIRRDLRGDPVVILPGQPYVTESALRASTGTHYTPRSLAEQVAEGALEPLVYHPGPLQTADRSAWKLRPAGEILALRVADIAMGSGVFLVAACRYLAGKLLEAWYREGNADALRALSAFPAESGLDLDVAADPLVIKARRAIIEHCLYGADINEMAVEMAKLSLWLVSVDPGRPFTFLDDKLAVGDSLLGITSIEQLEWMHLNPAEGRKLHGDTLPGFMSDVRRLLADVGRQRQFLAGIPDDIDGIARKREILDEVRPKTAELSRYADLLAGAAAVAGALGRRPLHWPLVFPEVFDPARPGFDAIIGNPPFLGGKKITGPLGPAYRDYLVEVVARGVKGSADLIAYFALRTHALLNSRGQAGLIATNTISQGDTREVGLDQIVADGVEIRRSVKSKPWPASGAMVEYATIWTSRHPVDPAVPRIADGAPVTGITPSLDPASRVAGNPARLAANAHSSFQGSVVLGLGFTMNPARAGELIMRDPRNAEVLLPYLNGRDLNSRPDCAASRWIIDFRDWPLEVARSYPDCFEQVLRQVRPERDKVKRAAYRERWWQYAEKQMSMRNAVAGLGRVIVIAQSSSTQKPMLVPTRQVFSHKLVVFASDDTALFALLSSGIHYWWTARTGSTLKRDLVYAPSDVFETFPLPALSPEMRELGGRLDTFRRDLLLSRQAGLTATYNLVHDPGCADADIAGLRDIHRAIDEAVARAYGWTDLLDPGLGHGFHDVRQRTSYTIGPVARQEILDRLLELNHARRAAEAGAGAGAGADGSRHPIRRANCR